MACRRCEVVLARNGAQLSHILKSAPRRTFGISTRYLKQGGLPVFGETSSSELDSILSTLRYKVFLPHAHLNQSQRKLVFREKYRSQLESEPVKVTIGDEDVVLEHFDHRKLPNTWELIRRIFELLSQEKQAKDWYSVVPTLMHGFQEVGFGMKPGRMVKLVRIANDAGMQDVVMRCLQQIKSTNLSLKHPEVRYEVLWGVHAGAQDGGQKAWGERQTNQAINQMRQLAIQLESRDHGGGHLNSNRDPRVSPALIGLLLELNAVRAYRHLDNVDTEGKVSMYAARLMEVLPLWRDDYFADAPNDGYKIVFRIILWQALNLARKVLGAEMPQAEAAGEKTKLLENQIQEQLGSDLSTIKPHYSAVRMKDVWDKRIQ